MTQPYFFLQKKRSWFIQTYEWVRNVREIRLTAPIDKITKKLTDNGLLKENEPYPSFL
jgi:hypothetical protein